MYCFSQTKILVFIDGDKSFVCSSRILVTSHNETHYGATGKTVNT